MVIYFGKKYLKVINEFKYTYCITACLLLSKIINYGLIIKQSTRLLLINTFISIVFCSFLYFHIIYYLNLLVQVLPVFMINFLYRLYILFKNLFYHFSYFGTIKLYLIIQNVKCVKKIHFFNLNEKKIQNSLLN